MQGHTNQRTIACRFQSLARIDLSSSYTDMERALERAFGSHDNHLEMTKLIMSGYYGLMHFYEMLVIPTLDTADYNDPNYEELLSTLKTCCVALTLKLRNISKVSINLICQTSCLTSFPVKEEVEGEGKVEGEGTDSRFIKGIVHVSISHIIFSQ